MKDNGNSELVPGYQVAADMVESLMRARAELIEARELWRTQGNLIVFDRYTDALNNHDVALWALNAWNLKASRDQLEDGA